MLVMRFLPDYAPFTIWSFNMPARAGDGRKLQLDKKFTCDTGMRLLCPSVSKPLRIWRKPQGMTIRMSPLCSIYLRLYTGILNSVVKGISTQGAMHTLYSGTRISTRRQQIYWTTLLRSERRPWGRTTLLWLPHLTILLSSMGRGGNTRLGFGFEIVKLIQAHLRMRSHFASAPWKFERKCSALTTLMWPSSSTTWHCCVRTRASTRRWRGNSSNQGLVVCFCK